MKRRSTKLYRQDNYVDDPIEGRSCGLKSSSYPAAPSFPSSLAASPEMRDGHRPPKTSSTESDIASGVSHALVSHLSLARSFLPNTAAHLDQVIVLETFAGLDDRYKILAFLIGFTSNGNITDAC